MIRVSAVDIDREKMMSLFYQQKTDQYLSQLTAADNKALALRIQNSQLQREIEQLRIALAGR